MSFSFKQSSRNIMMSMKESAAEDADDKKRLVDIGDEAPDFELQDEEGSVHKLSSFRGRRVILSFFRYAA